MCDTLGCGDGNGRGRPLPAVPLARRRAFLAGVASLPLAAVLADARLAKAAGHSLEHVSITTASGQSADAVLGLPRAEKAPAVLLVHEWWGLNDQIKAVTADLADRGFVALAVDLYQGKVATTREEASSYRTSMDKKWAREALAGWVGWLRGHERGNGKVGTVGWCFGGGWSLNASLVAPVDATVVYYGSVKKSVEDLAPLAGPVLGHFGTEDKWINAQMVGGFEKAMAEAGKTELTVHWYAANHAFANPSSARYDEDDAKLAWSRTLAFFYQHLA